MPRFCYFAGGLAMKFLTRSILILLALYGLVFALGKIGRAHV